MRNSSFQPKPRKPMKRSSFKNKTETALKRKNVRKRKKTGKKALPKWLTAIPESQAHGSGTYQKRLWRVTSDYVRIRDWHKYKVCVATGKRLDRWKDGHAGHLKPYSNCNAIYKFDLRNIHMQHGNSNKWGNRDTWIEFEKVVRNRGYDFDAFERDNRKAQGARLYDTDVVEEIKKVLKLMAKLPEQPEYYERAFRLQAN